MNSVPPIKAKSTKNNMLFTEKRKKNVKATSLLPRKKRRSTASCSQATNNRAKLTKGLQFQKPEFSPTIRGKSIFAVNGLDHIVRS